MRVITCFAFALVGTIPAYAQQQDFSQATVTPVRISDRLHVLVGPGGNIGVSSGTDGVFLVDDQFAPVTDKIRAAVATFSAQPIRFVLNTHWHGDHTGGNENLGSAGALIVAHDNVRVRMSSEQFIAAFNMRVPPSPEKALPVVTFSESATFHFNGEEIHATHVEAAHTDGDVIIHFRRDNVLHGGDTYFNGNYPFIDAASGGTLDGLVAAADLMLRLANDSTRIIPGHGPLATRQDLQEYRDMLAAIRDRLREEIRRGRTLEQVQAAKITARFDEKWAKGLFTAEQFVAIAWASMTGNR